jgi:large-conductance mechanosensitive channel
MPDSFNLETFIGLHIYLVAADLIFNILDKFIITIYENFLSPIVNVLLGDCLHTLKWKIGPNEEDVINLAAIIKECVKLFIIALLSFNIYKYFKKYKKYKELKFNTN